MGRMVLNLGVVLYSEWSIYSLNPMTLHQKCPTDAKKALFGVIQSIFHIDVLFLFGMEGFSEKIVKLAKKSTFYVKNQNSEHTFVSSTLKVEEIKVPSEFGFSP